MNAQQFIDAIKQVVRDGAIGETVMNLKRLPGRRPAQEPVELANWYRTLEPAQRALLERVVAQAVDSAVFGILSVIDGVRAIENGETRGSFELRYVKEGVTVLNASDGAMLHDLYKNSA